MKKIVCEMCGSTDLVKDNGVFVCQTCGCKYSVEEAKKMMVEGTVEVKGTVKIDSSNKIDNLIKNGKTLYGDSKTKEAYDLFGEVLNIDTENYIAIVYRGFCSAWESSVKEPKLLDAVKGISRGLELAKKKFGETKEYADFCMEVVLEMEKIGDACLNLYINYCKKQTDNYCETVKELTSSLKKSGIYADVDYYRRRGDELKKGVDQAQATCVAGINLSVTALNVVMSIVLNVKDAEIYSLKDYEKIKAIIEAYLKKANGWKLEKKQLDDGCLWIVICNERIKAVGNKKREAYWKEHKDLKQSLEKEIEDNQKEIEEIKKRIASLENDKKEIEKKINVKVPAEKELKTYNDKLVKLQEEKDSLGLFKGKEKKALQQQIDELSSDIEKIKGKVQKEQNELRSQYAPEVEKIDGEINKLNKEIDKLQGKIDSNQEELNKDRD